jgi:hypothetical protein
MPDYKVEPMPDIHNSMEKVNEHLHLLGTECIWLFLEISKIQMVYYTTHNSWVSQVYVYEQNTQ